MTGNDIEDVRTDMMAAIAEDCCTLVAMAKERQTNVTQVVYVDANHNDAVASVYGHTIHVWRAGDTMDGLASDLLGNPDLGPLIAYFNKIGDEASIEAGTRIKIPCLTETAASRGNMIYAQPGGHDGYGADMRIGEDGDLAAKLDEKLVTTSLRPWRTGWRHPARGESGSPPTEYGQP